MGKMYTLKPDESINDHMTESIAMLNELAKSIGADYYLNSTMIKGTKPDSVRFIIEHVRNTIEMLDELTDELEDREDEVRREYEEKVIRFFNSWMNTDMSDEYKSRAEAAAKRVHEIENHYMCEIQQLNKELEEERERSNQLEKENAKLREVLDKKYDELDREIKKSNQLERQLQDEHEKYVTLYEVKIHSSEYWKDQFERMCKKFNQLEKRCAEFVRNRDNTVDHWTKHCEVLLQKHREELAAKDHEIWELQEQAEYWEDLAKKYADPDGHKVNNPANFCGNCKHFVTHPNDIGTCNNKHADPYIVDPDDASCQAFESNNPTVVIDKPEFPCCDHCNHEDCDDCTLCPF